MIKGLTKILRHQIIQNSKRLRTFQRPQQTQVTPVNPQVFDQASLMTLVRIKSAFERLQEATNSPLSISFTELRLLEVSDGNGSHILQADREQSTMFYTSPLTGIYKYYFNAAQERFYSNKDGHLLEQNLSREVQKHMGDTLPL